MKKEEVIKKYGKSKAKKIFNKMKGQTTAIAKDGSEDFDEPDIIRASREIGRIKNPKILIKLFPKGSAETYS